MKKILAILLALAMVFAFAACVPAADPAPADDQDVEMEEELDNITGKKIGFINAGPDDYYAQFGDAFKAIGEAVGFVVTEVNSDYLPEKELANVQDMIAQGIDAIAVITVGAAGSAASIEAAYEADVPIFFIAGKPNINEGTDLTGHVTDNFVMMGYQLGKWVAENYPDAKKIVNIPGFLGQGPAEGEIVGFDLALTEAGMDPAILTASSEWQRPLAVPIMEDLLAGPNGDFDVLFACNEETFFGCLQVLEEQGITDKVIVSANGKDDAWPNLIDGTLAATSPNPPSLNADLCIQQMIAHFNGTPFEQYIQIMPAAVLTGENVETAVPWTVSDYLEGRANDEFMWKLSDYEENYLANTELFASFDEKFDAYMAAN
ncbi:MAG: substrate-binding domain-containing protein [Clostridia bacterium]|jgi:ribose transport system substrate-binding protein|nr:substrate-binding domain-containing protein [Clostridia bacterium]